MLNWSDRSQDLPVPPTRSSSMSLSILASIDNPLSRKYFQTLLAGDRTTCRQVIDQAIAGGLHPYALLTDLIYPTMELLQNLYREDRIPLASLNLATRLNRSITDQLTGSLERKESNGRKVLIFCGDDEPEELGGQICADLFEADGYTVRFVGG